MEAVHNFVLYFYKSFADDFAFGFRISDFNQWCRTLNGRLLKIFYGVNFLYRNAGGLQCFNNLVVFIAHKAAVDVMSVEFFGWNYAGRQGCGDTRINPAAHKSDHMAILNLFSNYL